MFAISTRQQIDVAPHRAWQVLGALPQWPCWCPTVTWLDVMNPGPVGIGSKVYVEQPGLRPAIWTITRWDPMQGFTWTCRHPGISISGDHRIVRKNYGCEVELRLQFRGWLSFLLRSWLSNVGSKAMAREVLALRQVCEGATCRAQEVYGTV